MTVFFSEMRIPQKISSFELFLSTWEYFKDFSYAIKYTEDPVNYVLLASESCACCNCGTEFGRCVKVS